MVNRVWTFLQFGVPEYDADVLYGSGFAAPDPILLIKHRGRSILVVTDFERDRARATAKVDEVWTASALAVEDAKIRHAKAPDLTPGGLAAAALRRLDTRTVEVPEQFPVGLAERLKQAGFRLTVCATPPFLGRRSKGPGEIRAITEVLRYSEHALSAAGSLLRHSRLENDRLVLGGRTLCAEDLRRVINLSLMESGCVASHTIVAPGSQAVDPHEEGSGPIRPGEPVVIDIFPRSGSSFYFADITRTLVRGRPSAALVRQYRAVLLAQRRALSLIRSGVAVRTVHRAVQQTFEELGFFTGEKDGRLQGFTHSTGHGVGLEIHEFPKIGLVEPSIRFRKGMVVAVEPGLYYLKTGGVRLEDLVVVTDRGVRNLTRYPKRLSA